MRAFFRKRALSTFTELLAEARRDNRVIDYVEVSRAEFRDMQLELFPTKTPCGPNHDFRGEENRIYGVLIKVTPAAPCSCSGAGACYNCR